MASFESGYKFFNALASTWAARVCRIISRPSWDSIVITETEQSSWITSFRSCCFPSTLMAMAAFAKPAPISFARSYPEDPSGNSLMLLSGNVSFMRIL